MLDALCAIRPNTIGQQARSAALIGAPLSVSEHIGAMGPFVLIVSKGPSRSLVLVHRGTFGEAPDGPSVL